MPQPVFRCALSVLLFFFCSRGLRIGKLATARIGDIGHGAGDFKVGKLPAALRTHGPFAMQHRLHQRFKPLAQARAPGIGIAKDRAPEMPAAWQAAHWAL